MANTFKVDTKSSCVTDAHTSTNANVLTAGGSATLVLLSILVSNKTGASADVDVFKVHGLEEVTGLPLEESSDTDHVAVQTGNRR